MQACGRLHNPDLISSVSNCIFAPLFEKKCMAILMAYQHFTSLHFMAECERILSATVFNDTLAFTLGFTPNAVQTLQEPKSLFPQQIDKYIENLHIESQVSAFIHIKITISSSQVSLFFFAWNVTKWRFTRNIRPFIVSVVDKVPASHTILSNPTVNTHVRKSHENVAPEYS